MRIGQRVRNLDGRSLGHVTALYDGAFAVRRGLFLFRRDHVVRDDEVRAVRDGELVVARSARDVHDLAAGLIPPAWRIAAPPSFPSAATPGEAQYVYEDLARGAISPAPPPAAETFEELPRAAEDDPGVRRPAAREAIPAPPR